MYVNCLLYCAEGLPVQTWAGSVTLIYLAIISEVILTVEQFGLLLSKSSAGMPTETASICFPMYMFVYVALL